MHGECKNKGRVVCRKVKKRKKTSPSKKKISLGGGHEKPEEGCHHAESLRNVFEFSGEGCITRTEKAYNDSAESWEAGIGTNSSKEGKENLPNTGTWERDK